MLRWIVVVAAVFCLAAAAGALLSHAAPLAISFGSGGVLLLAGTLLERVRYKRIAEVPPKGAVRTAERFADPKTGKLITVYVDPVTGERTYVGE